MVLTPENNFWNSGWGSIPRSWTVVSSSERNWGTAAGPSRTARAQACTAGQGLEVGANSFGVRSELWCGRVRARWLQSGCCGVTCSERASGSSRKQTTQRQQPKNHGLSPTISWRSQSLQPFGGSDVLGPRPEPDLPRGAQRVSDSESVTQWPAAHQGPWPAPVFSQRSFESFGK